MREKTPFSLDDYYNFKFLSSASVSNDGSKIAYVLLTYHNSEPKEDVKDQFPKEEKSNIWILDVSTKESRQYTFSESNNSPSFSPDGKNIAFISKRSSEPQMYLISVDGGEAQQLTHLKIGVGSKPIWSPDGKQIAFSASSLDKKPDLKKPYRYTRDFYRLDAAGNVDHFKENIYILTVATKELKQLTNDNRHHSSPCWSPDGNRLIWLTNFSQSGVDVFNAVLSVYEDGKISEHLQDWGYCELIAWISNTSLVFQGRPKERIIGAKDDLYTYNLYTKEMNCRSTLCQLGIGGGLESFTPGSEGRLNKLVVDSDRVYTSIQIGGKWSIYAFTLTGDESFEEIVGGDRACYIQDIKSKTVFFSSANFNSPMDIYSFDLPVSTEEQLTSLNKEFLETKVLPEWKKFEVTGIDGVKTDGWFLLPQGPSPYPTLLKIHGGLHSGYGYVFYWDAQLLISSGYAVLMVNHRGSTGYGDSFATAIIGDWGNLDYQDLMAGVDAAIDLGLADANRLGCFGISGGGNLSSWIVGQTTRFKAAVPENPVTNWLSFYGVSDIGRWFSVQEVGGLPHEVPDKYVKMSPITYAYKCKTPTLMIQHDNDLRCPVEQSEQFYAVLRDAGCIVEMLRMPGTPHGGSIMGPLEIRQARSVALLDWFNKYLLT